MYLISFSPHYYQVIEVVRHPQDKAESKYNPDAGISKEDEERYQKLMKENEELQRLIVQVSTKFIYVAISMTFAVFNFVGIKTSQMFELILIKVIHFL